MIAVDMVYDGGMLVESVDVKRHLSGLGADRRRVDDHGITVDREVVQRNEIQAEQLYRAASALETAVHQCHVCAGDLQRGGNGAARSSAPDDGRAPAVHADPAL